MSPAMPMEGQAWSSENSSYEGNTKSLAWSLDVAHHAAQYFKSASRGKLQIDWEYVRVVRRASNLPLLLLLLYFFLLGVVSAVQVLNQSHPGMDSAFNYYNWCEMGTGQGYDDVMNDAIHQAAEQSCNGKYDAANFNLHAVVFPYVPGNNLTVA
jgi:hypothetical protein